jgi:hypothetical protein
MATKRPHPTARRWSYSMLVGLLIALTTWTGAWPQARARDAGSAPPRPLGTRLHVAVRDGQLSVDLREAQMRDVLAAIGRQAGLRVRVDAAANRTVNAQFTDMELDQGLRRLLRVASLSYSLLYAPSPAATVILQEVRVFGEERGGASVGNNREPAALAQRAAALQPSPQRVERGAPESLEQERVELEPEPVELEPEEPDQAVDAQRD